MVMVGGCSDVPAPTPLVDDADLSQSAAGRGLCRGTSRSFAPAGRRRSGGHALSARRGLSCRDPGRGDHPRRGVSLRPAERGPSLGVRERGAQQRRVGVACAVSCPSGRGHRMTDPMQIQRDYRSVKLDRRIRWRERHDARVRGINHPTFTDREVWAKRYESESTYSVSRVRILCARIGNAPTFMRFDERIKPT